MEKLEPLKESINVEISHNNESENVRVGKNGIINLSLESKEKIIGAGVVVILYIGTFILGPHNVNRYGIDETFNSLFFYLVIIGIFLLFFKITRNLGLGIIGCLCFFLLFGSIISFILFGLMGGV